MELAGSPTVLGAEGSVEKRRVSERLRSQRPSAPGWVWLVVALVPAAGAGGWFAGRASVASVAPVAVAPAPAAAAGPAEEPAPPPAPTPKPKRQARALDPGTDAAPAKPPKKMSCGRCCGLGEVVCPDCKGGTIRADFHEIFGGSCNAGLITCPTCKGRDKNPAPTHDGLRRTLITCVGAGPESGIDPDQDAYVQFALEDPAVQSAWERGDLRGVVARAGQVQKETIQRAMREREAQGE